MTRRALLVLLVWAVVALGQAREFDFYARGPHAGGVPRPEAVLGYPIGQRHSYHHQMEAYIHALEKASARVKVVQYGESYEGRKTYLVLITSEENQKRLEEIRASIARLRDPRQTSAAEAQKIIAGTPAIVWLNYANDGNESAAFEASMQMAYQLAAGEDAETRLIRERVVAVLNPAHNPESHDRFVTWYNAAVHGRNGTPDRSAIEHNGDWLMDSNDNHYHIDLNRDALGLTQKETREIVRQIHHWNPQVFIDHHGNPPIFFFPPVALPVNQNFPGSTGRWEQVLGRAIAAEFDKYGWSYMNREVFDLFYPGYFDSYPGLNGATGMTFETDGGGSQGLQLERADGTFSTLRGGIAKHFAGGYAVLKATAENKDKRLEDFYQFRKSGIEEGERGPAKQYVLLPGKNPEIAASLAALLLEHRAELYRSTAPFRSARAHSYATGKPEARQFPEGAYVVPLNQPQKRLIQALLEPEAKLDEKFIAEEKAKKERNERLGRRAARERDGFYDVTAWSLPLSFGVEAYWTEDRQDTGLTRLETAPAFSGGIVGDVNGGRARYGYIFPYSHAALKLIATLFREDYKMAVSRAEVKVGNDTYPPGSIVLRAERNPEKLHERLKELAGASGVTVRALSTPWTDLGITLGSGRVVDLKKPRVAVAAYSPTTGRGYGALWFLLEQMLDVPFTPIRTEQLRNADLSKYNVIIFPDGSDSAYQEILGAAGVARLKSWVESGGVFIGLRGGAAFATRRGVEWTTSRLLARDEAARRGPGAGAAAATATAAGAAPQEKTEKPAEAEKERPPEKEVDRTPGAMMRLEVNPAHYLGFGYEPEQVGMHNSNLIFTLSKEGTNVATYAKQNVKLSGFVWPDTEKRLAGSAYLIDENVGRGHVILFADDPNFRLLWPRLTRMFLSGVFFAPSLQ